MKRKILSLVFAAAMLLGTATMTSANDWDCVETYVTCGPGGLPHMALVCGDTPQDQIDQYKEWQEILCLSN